MAKKPTADCQALIDESLSLPLLFRVPSSHSVTATASNSSLSGSDSTNPSHPVPKLVISRDDKNNNTRHLQPLPNLLDIRVRKALSLLAGMKEKVIQMRYGLFNGLPPMNYEQIANELTQSLTMAQRWVLARKQGIHPDKVQITTLEVQDLEAEALRDMRPKSGQFKLTVSRN